MRQAHLLKLQFSTIRDSYLRISFGLRVGGRNLFRFFEFRYEGFGARSSGAGDCGHAIDQRRRAEQMVFRGVLGTAACCLVLAITSFVRWQKPGAGYVLVGSLLYLIGTISVTIACNVPLNDALAAVDPLSGDAGRIWTNYLNNWTAWNHVRTGAALVAAASFTVALCRASSWIDLARSETSSSPMSATLPHQPEDWPRVFEQHLNGGDLDAVMMLYEPEAHFVTKSGETLVGHDAIRSVLGGLIEAKTHFQSRVVRVVTVGDIAQRYTDFEGTRVNESGKTVPVHNNAIEVLRRQPDRSWKLIMGDPNARE